MKRSITSFLCMLSMLVAVATADAYTAPSDPAQVKPLKVGDPAPTFTVRTAKGDSYVFDANKRSKPALFIFYRGGWCPYCNAQLASLRKAEPELIAMGYEVLFMSTDRPELLYSSLKEPGINYTLLSDSKMQAAEAFGVAFRMDDAAVARYKNFGVDLEATTGETHHELPVPSVFIIDKAGVIRFVHWNPDFKVRLGADEILAAGRAAVSK
jgi:peroxiredoxin